MSATRSSAFGLHSFEKSPFWSESVVQQKGHSVSRCPDIVNYLAISYYKHGGFGAEMPPFMTSSNPDFEDVSMGGASFDVRKVRTATIPIKFTKGFLRNPQYVVVKQPRVEIEDVKQNGMIPNDLLSEMATEVQVLRHEPLRKHENIVNYLGSWYHDAGPIGRSIISPASVIEYAEFGSLQSYQTDGYLTSIKDKISVCTDVARGLQALHDCGIIHGDVKTSNVLLCRSPTRELVAKLTDFGYSISFDDKELVGFTNILAAPEVSSDIQEQYLPQLDMYSYALLLHAVFRNGNYFYEKMPEELREKEVSAIKSSGIIAATLQLDLMRSLRGQRCFLAPLCKILEYSLQPSPAQRLPNMTKIVHLLALSGPKEVSLGSSSCDEGKDVQREHSTLTSFQMVQDALWESMGTFIEEYISSLSQSSKSFGPEIREALFNQAKDELSMFYDGVPCGARVGTRIELLSCFIHTYAALYKEPVLVKRPETTGDVFPPSPDKLVFLNAQIMPDFATSHSPFALLPKVVVQAAVQNLESLCFKDGDPVRKPWAELCLAEICTNGAAGKVDLPKAAKLVFSAAKSGNRLAQYLYAITFFSFDVPDAAKLADRYDWLNDTATKGYPVALQILRTIDPRQWKKTKADHEIQKLNLDGFSKRLQGQSTWVANDVRLFAFLVITSDYRRLDLLLAVYPALLRQDLPNDDTAFLISSRLGNARMVKYLLRKGSKLIASTEPSLSPLHWLSSFDSEDMHDIATLLIVNGAAVDSISMRSHTDLLYQIDDSIPNAGSPLHWAVADGSLAAVDALVTLGADATSRVSSSGIKAGNQETSHLSPFELACHLNHDSILERLLAERPVKRVISKLHPTDPGSLTLARPLYYALSGMQRWDRMRRHGIAFEEKARETIRLLTKAGADTNAVQEIEALEAPKVSDVVEALRMSKGAGALRMSEIVEAVKMCEAKEAMKMSAVFAVVSLLSGADILRSGLEFGFKTGLDATFGDFHYGGTALFVAIKREDHELFQILLENGANIYHSDMEGNSALHRAAKETDDTFFAEKLLDSGAILESNNLSKFSPFETAVWHGNFAIARCLYDRGADRDRYIPLVQEDGCSLSLLGMMISKQTRNSAKRVKFLIDLPDRHTNGFIVAKYPGGSSSVYTEIFKYPYHRESPDQIELANTMILSLIGKFGNEEYLNRTKTWYGGSVVSMAAKLGHFKAVEVLLSSGADPNLADEDGATPMDIAYGRYCDPAATFALKDIDIKDSNLVARTLALVNRNTSELLSLLRTYRAETRLWVPPIWYWVQPGYRSLNWVLEVLKERRNPYGQRSRRTTLTEPIRLEDEASIEVLNMFEVVELNRSPEGQRQQDPEPHFPLWQTEELWLDGNQEIIDQFPEMA